VPSLWAYFFELFRTQLITSEYEKSTVLIVHNVNKIFEQNVEVRQYRQPFLHFVTRGQKHFVLKQVHYPGNFANMMQLQMQSYCLYSSSKFTVIRVNKIYKASHSHFDAWRVLSVKPPHACSVGTSSFLRRSSWGCSFPSN
jgi:hypothetical protein